MQTMIDIEAMVDAEIEAIATEVQRRDRQEQLDQTTETTRKSLTEANYLEQASEKLREALGSEIFEALGLAGTGEWFLPNTASFTFARYGETFVISTSRVADDEFKFYLQNAFSGFMHVIKGADLWDTVRQRLSLAKVEHLETSEWIRVSEEIEAEIKAKVEEAKQSMWQFPESLTLYHWRWVCGGEESGWSLTDTIGSDGYVQILGREVQDLKINSANTPVIHRKKFHSITSLPRTLREMFKIEIPGIKQHDPEEDGLEGYSRDPESSTHADVGEVAIAPIREFVDANR